MVEGERSRVERIFEEGPHLLKKRIRPSQLISTTKLVETGCGHLYVTLGWLNADENSLVEVIANLGKAGGCANSQLEGLTRLVSLSLKYEVPLPSIIKALKDLKCPNKTIEGGDTIHSCGDGISALLGKEEELRNERFRIESRQNSPRLKVTSTGF